MNSPAPQLNSDSHVPHLHGLANLMSRVYHGEDLTDLGLDFIDRGGKGDAQALLICQFCCNYVDSRIPA